MSIADAIIASMERQAAKLQHAQAREWGREALVGAVTSTPGPGDTKYATGRARASTWVNSKTPRRFDAGKRSVYQIPTGRRADFGLRGRKPDDDVVLDQGVDYDWNVEKHHHPIANGARAGKAALLAKRTAHVRKAMAGGKRVTIRI